MVQAKNFQDFFYSYYLYFFLNRVKRDKKRKKNVHLFLSLVSHLTWSIYPAALMDSRNNTAEPAHYSAALLRTHS